MTQVRISFEFYNCIINFEFMFRRVGGAQSSGNGATEQSTRGHRAVDNANQLSRGNGAVERKEQSTGQSRHRARSRQSQGVEE